MYSRASWFTFEAFVMYALLLCFFVWFLHWPKIYLPLLHLCIFIVCPWHLAQSLRLVRSSINTCWMNSWLDMWLYSQRSPVSSGPGQALGTNVAYTPLLRLPNPCNGVLIHCALAHLVILYGTPDSLEMGLSLSSSQRLEPCHSSLDQAVIFEGLPHLLLWYRVTFLASMTTTLPGS